MSNTRWYVLHAYSGYEKKVADSILDQANKLGIQDHIEDISVPTQNIVEVKRGVRVNTSKEVKELLLNKIDFLKNNNYSQNQLKCL